MIDIMQYCSTLIIQKLLAINKSGFNTINTRDGDRLPANFLAALEQLLDHSQLEIVEWTLRTLEQCGPQSFGLKAKILEKKPKWVVLAELDHPKLLINASDLAKYLEKAPEKVLMLEEDIDLREIPGQQIVLPPIHEQATLLEAYRLMKTESTDAVFVQNPRPFALDSEVMGIVTREAITSYYSV